MTDYVEWKGKDSPDGVEVDTKNIELRATKESDWTERISKRLFYSNLFYRIKEEDIPKVDSPKDSDYVYWEGENCPEGLTKESDVEYFFNSRSGWKLKGKTERYWTTNKYRVRKSELKSVKKDIKNDVLVPDGYRLLEVGERFDEYSNILMNSKSNLPHKTKGWVDSFTHPERKTVEEDDTLWYCVPLKPKDEEDMEYLTFKGYDKPSWLTADLCQHVQIKSAADEDQDIEKWSDEGKTFAFGGIMELAILNDYANSLYRIPMSYVPNSTQTKSSTESDSMFLSLLKFKAVRSGLYWWFAEPTKNIGRVGLTTLRYASTVALAGSILYGGHYVVKNKSTLIDKIPSVKLEFK